MKANELLTKMNFPSILLYGPAGCGKTALASQAKNAYMFDFDGGMRTAALMEDKFSVLRRDCEFDTYIDDNPAMPKMWMKAEAKIYEFVKQSASNTLKYDAIIIDSLTGLTRAMKLQTMYTAMNDAFANPQIQHWGAMVNATEKALTLLRSLKCLLIVTAHETSVESDGLNLIRPMSVTDKHSMNKLPWLFDEVLHCKIKQAGAGKQDYIVSGLSTTCIMARTRSKMAQEIKISENGLAGLLEMIGFSKKGEVNELNKVMNVK